MRDGQVVRQLARPAPPALEEAMRAVIKLENTEST